MRPNPSIEGMRTLQQAAICSSLRLAEHQIQPMQTPLRFLKLCPGEAGVSRFGQVEIEVALRNFAPPALPFGVSPLEPATQCGFLNLPVGWVGEMHPSPIRMWIFVLSGTMEFEAGDGEVVAISPGSAMLLEDLTGGGHSSRVIGNVAATLAAVRLPVP